MTASLPAIIYLLCLGVVLTLSGFIAWYFHKHRDIPGVTTFILLAVSIGALALMDAFSVIGLSARFAGIWFDLRFVCLSLIPVMWLIFIVQYSGSGKLVTAPRVALLCVIPAITQIMIWTNAFHHLWVLKPVSFQQEGFFWIAQTASRMPGPWMWTHVLYSYLLVAVSLAILAVMAVRVDRRDMAQVLAVGLGTLIMAIVAALPVFGILPDGWFNPLVFGLAAGVIVIFWGYYRHRFLRHAVLLREEARAPVVLIALFILLASGIAGAGYYTYQHYAKTYRLEYEYLLSSIADLKVGEMVQWRKERMADASGLHQNEAFDWLVRRTLDHPGDLQATQWLHAWLRQFKDAYQYQIILLLDASGRLRFSTDGEAHAICDQLTETLASVREQNQIRFLDFHRETPGQGIILSILVPVSDARGFLGAVAFVMNPEDYLYPLLQYWPTPAQTAETLLVRREGDEVVFLNHLKFQKDAALNLRFPLTQDTLPAARAVLGEQGIVEGIDYRGEPVIAALRSVTDSPWFMVARVDSAEVYAPIRERLWSVLLLVFALIACTGIGILFLWQRQSARFVNRQLEAAQASAASEEKFRKVFMTSPDAISITRWRDAVIVSVNAGFTRNTGYSREEAEGKTAMDLGLYVEREDLQVVIRQLKTHGGLLNAEIRFRSKEGNLLYGLVSGSFIELNGESYILLIARDITEIRLAQDALRKAHDSLQSFFSANVFGAVVASVDGRILEANDYFLTLIGFNRREFEAGAIDWRSLTPPDWLVADEDAIAQVRSYGTSAPYEKQYLRRDGTRVDVFMACAALSGDPERVAAFVIDNTGRKKAQREVLRLNEELEARVQARTAELQAKNEELERLNRIFVDRELKMRELKEKIARLEHQET